MVEEVRIRVRVVLPTSGNRMIFNSQSWHAPYSSIVLTRQIDYLRAVVGLMKPSSQPKRHREILLASSYQPLLYRY